MNLKDVFDREILPAVLKPSRYLGTELNSTHKSPDEVDLRMALVFPDLYNSSVSSNLGLLILYSILNERPLVLGRARLCSSTGHGGNPTRSQSSSIRERIQGRTQEHGPHRVHASDRNSITRTS